jgi:hypothetical protein
MSTVYVTDQGEPAQSQPQFIIKMGSVYYLTRAIWQYDFELATTDDQREGVAQIANEFSDLGDGANLVARQRPDGAGGGADPNQTPPQDP